MTDYYVRPTNGSDGNAGTSFAAAYKTTSKADSVVAAGDTVFLCNEANESITTGMVWSTAGTRGSPIRWIGADSVDGSPLNGSGQYTWSCNLSSGNDGVTIPSFNYLQDIHLTRTAGGSDEGYKSGSGTKSIVFVRCAVSGGWTNGWETDVSDCIYIDCEASGCTTGYDVGGDACLFGCRAHDNTGDGFFSSATEANYVGCASYDNGADGFDVGASNDGVSFYKCVAYGNSSDGFEIDDTDHITVVNCTSCANGGYGYNYTGTGTWTITFGFNHSPTGVQNEFNTSGPTNELGDWADQGIGGNIDGDPLFTSVVDGSEDFTPATGSPLINSGFPENWGMTTVGNMGPLKEAAGGGGGDQQNALVGVGGLAL